MTGKKKVKQTIRNHRIRKVSLVMACICCLFVAVSNPTVQAQMPEWMRWSYYMNRNYEKDFAEYEKEFNETLVNEDGYKLHIYKMAQSRFTLAVEYQLEDPNGNILEKNLFESGLARKFLKGSAVGGGGIDKPVLLENGHQRSILFYEGGADYDFTQEEGQEQVVSFYFSAHDMEQDTPLRFPEMRFVMEEIYEGMSYSHEESVLIGDYTMYLHELSYEGGALKLVVFKPDDVSKQDLYFELKIKDEVIKWKVRGGTAGIVSDNPIFENYKRDYQIYQIDMQSGDEITLIPTLVVSEKDGEYIRGEEIKVKFDK